MKKFILWCALCVFGCTIVSHAQVEIIQTIAGTGTAGNAGDGGQAATAQMNLNYMMVLDALGNLYFADNNNSRIQKITASTGIITTIAGTGVAGFTADNVAASASRLNTPVGIAIDASNNIYIGDETNNRIRKVNGLTGIITTIAGTGTAGTSPDGTVATAALINLPRGVAVNSAGDVYFSEGGTTTTKVRMVSAATGNISTVAGTGTAGAAIDGVAATLSPLNNPRGVYVDAAGNLFIADMNNNRIRMVIAGTGIITTVAGNGTAGYLGDGVAATSTTINLPTSMKFDVSGNMYIADVSNNRIRKVNTSGIISTVAGSGTGGFAGDGSAATAAAVKLNAAVDMAIMPNPNYFYISDRSNNRIRLVKPNSTPYFPGGTQLTLTVCENSAATSINSLLAIIDSDKSQTETWTTVLAPVHGTLVTTGTSVSTGGTITPTGKTYTPSVGYSGLDSFYVQVSDGFNTSRDTIIVTINPLPVVAAIAGAAPVCVAANVVLTDATPGGTWSESTGDASVTGGTVTGDIGGSDVISYAVLNSCGTTTVTVNITVNPLPDAGTIFGGSSVCISTPLVLTDALPGGTWSASNGNATVVGGTVTGVVAGTTDDISYTVANSCGTDIATTTITIMDVPGAGTTLTGTPVVCVGATTVLSNTVTGGTWSESTGNSSVTGGTVLGLIAGTDDITYSLSNTCGINNITQTVTVNPLPNAGSISGFTSVCIGGTITLIDAAGSGTWSAGNTNASVSISGVVTGLAVGSDVISYSVSNSCGLAVATSTINVVSIPSAGVITGAGTVCQGANATLTDIVPGGAWSASNGNATVAGGTVTGVSSGTDVISYTVVFSCGTAIATKTVTINPLPSPAAISGASSVCLAASTLLTDATPGGVWSALNINASVSGGLVTGAVIGTDVINYSVTNACGTVTVTVNMSIDPVVTPAVSFSASPGFTTCPSTLVTYTANPVNGGGAPAYQWKVNGSSLGSGAAFIYTPVNGDRVTCDMSSSLACISAVSVADTDTVVVNPTLVPATTITVGITGDTLCVGDVATFTATAVNGGTAPTYQWNVSGLIYGFANPFSYVPANGDVVTCSLTSSYACPLPATVTSNSITMTVNTTEAPTVDISVAPGSSVCAGSPATFTVHSLYGGTAPFYRWTKNGVNVATGPEYIYLPSTGDMIYAMLSSSATCSTADSVFSNLITMSTVAPTAITVSISASAGLTVGVHRDDTLTATVTGPASPTYQWFVNGSAVAGATNSTYIVNKSLVGTEIVNCVAGSGDACATTAISNLLSLTISVGVMQVPNTANVMTLLPNPNKGKFTMNVQSDNDEPVEVVITNMVGEKVMEFSTATNKETAINLNQASGVYLLSASTEHGRSVAKVVVE